MPILQKYKYNLKGEIRIKKLLLLNLIFSSIRCIGVIGTSAIAVIAFGISAIKRLRQKNLFGEGEVQ